MVEGAGVPKGLSTVGDCSMQLVRRPKVLDELPTALSARLSMEGKTQARQRRWGVESDEPGSGAARDSAKGVGQRDEEKRRSSGK